MITNDGTAALYSQFWELELDNKSYVVNAELSNPKVDQGYAPRTNFLAGEQRRIVITFKEGFPLSDISEVRLKNVTED